MTQGFDRAYEVSPSQVVALVLAGGRGTRLGDLTRHCAKPALPFGGQHRVIDFTLSNCINSGIRRIGVLTQHQAQTLIHHLRRGWSYLPGALDEFIEIWPAQQKHGNHWYRGTADAVYQNLDAIIQLRPRLVLVLAGDHVYRMDYRAMIQSHVDAGADVTVACHEVPVQDATRYGVVEVDRQLRIHGFAEKPSCPRGQPSCPEQALVSMGVYLFDADCLVRELCHDGTLTSSQHDFGHDVIPRLTGSRRVFAHRFDDARGDGAYWRDIGTLEAYHEANMALLETGAELDLLDERWPMRTQPYNARPTRFLSVGGLAGTATDSLVAPGCAVAGASVAHSVLSENVEIRAGSSISHSVILPRAVIGQGCRIRGAVIDSGCRIPPGTAIDGNDPRTRRMLHVTENAVTLVTQAALDRRQPHAVPGKPPRDGESEPMAEAV